MTIFCTLLQKSHKNLLISMNSHGIPLLSDKDEAAGAPNDPEPKIRKAGFIQALRFFRKQEIRRASEQTSPQVARAVGHTRKDGTRAAG